MQDHDRSASEGAGSRHAYGRRGRGVVSAFLLLLGLGLPSCGDPAPRAPAARPAPAVPEALEPIPDAEWVGLVAELSEPGGYFDTDNLISNETSYLHVLGPMDRLGVQGGAYVGVGPDQSFSYIAQQRPELAFILDVRRDNLLHHLLLKALFHEADRRVDYLALLFGRSVPEWSVAPGSEMAAGSEVAPGPDSPARRSARAPDRAAGDDGDPWLEAGPEDLLAALDRAPGGRGSAVAAAAWARLRDRIRSFGLPLADEDLRTIERFHAAFVEAGAGLRFTSHGRAPRPYYPTFAQLLTETDLDGERGSYLATEASFRIVDGLQERNRVIPVVGDLAGPSALEAIGSEVRARGLTVRVFYTSNVEYYLVRNGTFPRFATVLRGLPVDRWSVLVRSVFPSAARHPHAVRGYYSTQTLVRMEDVHEALSGSGYAGYADLVSRDAIPLRLQPTPPKDPS